MARPRLGKDVSLRVQLVIPAELVQRIDAWRLAHQIGSRSEAIRDLCEIGLEPLRTYPTDEEIAEYEPTKGGWGHCYE